MGWLIAIFAVFVVAGSVAWIKPSKRELRLTELRRHAMQLGVRVRLLDEKTKNNMFPWLSDYRGYVLYENHALALREDRPMRAFEVNSDKEMHELDRINMDVACATISAFESKLPSGVRGVVVYPDGAGVVWDEQGDNESVDVLLHVIADIHQSIS